MGKPGDRGCLWPELPRRCGALTGWGGEGALGGGSRSPPRGERVHEHGGAKETPRLGPNFGLRGLPEHPGARGRARVPTSRRGEGAGGRERGARSCVRAVRSAWLPSWGRMSPGAPPERDLGLHCVRESRVLLARLLFLALCFMESPLPRKSQLSNPSPEISLVYRRPPKETVPLTSWPYDARAF